MHGKPCNFLGKDKSLNKKFAFGKDFSTNHAIFSLLQITHKVVDDGPIACRI